ncbi:MAG TPA: ACT domain-containing protein [Firmicutes bacterium]|nr:ACT domain-containing protein [Bacillota bacterium]
MSASLPRGPRERRSDFFLVAGECLPVVLRKTLQVKELLRSGAVATVGEATAQVGISRSAYYKYRDGVFPLAEGPQDRVVTVHFLLEHRSGVLSALLSQIANLGGNVLTINQGIPVGGVANVTVAFAVPAGEFNLEKLLDSLQACIGVRKVELVLHKD